MANNQYSKLSRPWEQMIAMRSLEFGHHGGASHRNGRGHTGEESSPAIPIPESMVVTAAAYRKFMRKNRLHEVVEGLLEGVDVTRMEDLQHPAAQIKGIIHNSQIPEPLFSRINTACQRLGSGVILVWPVTAPYETFRCSSEYQEDLYLEANNPAQVIGAIKTWWASLFDAAAIHFRGTNQQDHRDVDITVAAQQAPLPPARRLLLPVGTIFATTGSP